MRSSSASGLSEGGSPKTFRALRKINRAGLRRHFEETQRAGYAKALAAGGFDAFTFIHEQQIGMDRFSQSDNGRFSFIETDGTRIYAGGFEYLKPNGRMGDPTPHL